MKELLSLVLITTALSVFSDDRLVRSVELASPYSFNCYKDSDSYVYFNIGAYQHDTEGTKVFNSTVESMTVYLNSKMCFQLQLVYKTIKDKDGTGENAVTILLDEDDKLVAFQDPRNKSIFIME